MFAANKYYFLKQYRLRNIFSITILQIEIQAPDCLMQRFQVTSAWKIMLTALYQQRAAREVRKQQENKLNHAG